ncbi:MAG: response regulator [Magnetococcales bacterium]|nr:response regulator [Magnetococcales bacterium]NGZ28444.1 response regulator [Magnetococcales bacterium]
MDKKILAVDDSLTIRQSVKFAMERQGYQVETASSGAEALQCLGRGKVNLIITDLHMDGMNGLELIEKIRANPTYKFTPILMLTTESSQEIIAQGKKAGANGWLVKPFKPEQMAAVVEKVLR